MFIMVTSKDSSLPVVHIRVVYEQGCKVYPCDFCFQSFSSEKSLASHVCTNHTFVNVQDVFVCSICNYCLLSQADLVEHIALRHQFQLLEECDVSYKLCEYCGAKLSSLETLGTHLRTDHGVVSFNRCSSSNITELSLADISNIGMGDKKSKTLFKVLDLPLKKKDTLYFGENECLTVVMGDRKQNYKVKCSGTSKLSHLNKDKVHQKSSEGKGSQNDTCIAEINVNKDLPLDSNCKKQNLMSEIPPSVKNDNLRNSEFAITIHSEPDELAKGELVLTVESEENLNWSKDAVSKVISSSGIFRKSAIDYIDPSVVVEKVCDDANDTDHSQLELVGFSREAEIVTQLCSGRNYHKADDSPSSSVESKRVSETHVVVGCVDGKEKFIAGDKGLESKNTAKKRRDCCICGRTFTNMGELERHEGTVHGIRIRCNLCSETFAFSKSLRTHYLRKHNDSESFPCEFCGRHFKSRSNLWSHRLSHIESAKKHTCPQCPQRFHSKSKLNNHLQTHSGKKKYQCGECSKGFLYPSQLVQHMGKHFSEEKWDVPENETFYLVEVETEKAEAKSIPSDKQPQ